MGLHQALVSRGAVWHLVEKLSEDADEINAASLSSAPYAKDAVIALKGKERFAVLVCDGRVIFWKDLGPIAGTKLDIDLGAVNLLTING